MKIGITQRVDISSTKEKRDALDQAWTRLLTQLGFDIVLIPNTLDDIKSYIQSNQLKGFLLSGGNNISRQFIMHNKKKALQLPCLKNSSLDRDRTESRILQFAKQKKLPILGVCRGMQVMNVFFGGSLRKISGHVATTHFLTKTHAALQTRIRPFIPAKANSYHDYAFFEEDMANCLVPLVKNSKCIEAIKHKKLPFWGIMWHPERYTNPRSNDLKLIKGIFQQRS